MVISAGECTGDSLTELAKRQRPAHVAARRAARSIAMVIFYLNGDFSLGQVYDAVVCASSLGCAHHHLYTLCPPPSLHVANTL